MQVVKGEDQRIHVSGRITSENAGDLSQKLMEYAFGHDSEEEKEADDTESFAEKEVLVLDLSGVTYISSAGLRVLMSLYKSGKKLRLVGVTPDVYEIFEVTGMTRLFEIRRALRKVSVEGLPLIGTGASASVYRLDGERIIKVFVPEMPEEFVYRENEITREAFLSGIDTMVAYDIVSTEKGLAAIYEDLHARDLINCMKEDHSRIPELVRGFGCFVRGAHALKLDAQKFPDAREDMASMLARYEMLDISKETADILVDLLKKMIPGSDEFSHGDCHVGNVMMKDDGRYMFIDVGRMSRGHIVYDLISMFVQYRYQSFRGIRNLPVSPCAQPFSEEERLQIWKTYFRYATGIEEEALTRKAEEQISVIAGIRMLSGRVLRRNFLPDECYDRFVKEALAYAADGGEPLLF